MTEAQMQMVLDQMEGLRQQLSTFSDTVLLELEASRLRDRKILAEVCPPEPV